jgi:hypothetical protein
LPAASATNSATDLISFDESRPLKEGILPPPLITCVSTVASSGFSWSRFGPTLPVVPAAARVWQLPQLVAKMLLPVTGVLAGCGATSGGGSVAFSAKNENLVFAGSS